MLWASLCQAKKNLEKTTLPRSKPTHGPQFFQACAHGIVVYFNFHALSA
jgi:hypothetical protein